MAIFHQRCRILTRSHGKSPVASSAYQAGEKLKDHRTNSTYAYKKPEVGAKGILVPLGVPSYSRAELWNKVEAFEDARILERYNPVGKEGEAKKKTLDAREKALGSAQTAQATERALPVELTLEQNKALVETFFHECYVSKGFFVDYAIHLDEGNPHVHYMVPLRKIEGSTFAKKKETSYRRTKDVRNLFDRGGMREVAELWCQLTNEALKDAGINAQIDHRSYKEQGIDLIPTKHRGYNADKMPVSRIVHENTETRLENLRRVLKDPILLLKQVASKRVVFGEDEIEREILNHVSVDMEAYSLLRDKVSRVLRTPPLWRRIFTNPDFATKVTGTLYALKSTQDRENQIVKVVNDLKGMNPSLVRIVQEKIRAPLDMKREVKRIEQTQGITFTKEQRAAIDHLMKKDRIQVVSGRAGTGKTTILKAVSDLYQKQGYEIMGTAFQGKVVDSLQNDLNQPAYTLSKLVSVWDYYKGPLSPRAQHTLRQYSFTKNHVVVLDEGSMVPDNLWEKLLLKIKETGAKLIIVQDQMQIKALYGLDIPRYVEEKVGACSLTNVVRQKIDWQQQASKLLNDHYTLEGLKAYESRIVSNEGQIVEDFLREKSFSVMLTLSNKDVERLNREAFDKLLARGEIESSFIHCDQEFALGARVMFGENDLEKNVHTLEGNSLGVRNGTMGVIVSHDRGETRVRLRDGRLVGFRDYESLSLAYATTINKSQGMTFDKTFVLYHPLMDANKLLVAMTRHREDVWLYSKRSIDEMARGGDYRPLIRDYTLTPEQASFKKLVEAYKESHKNLSTKKETRKAYAQSILQSWDQTKLFVMQSGLRKEMIEMHGGLRPYKAGRIEREIDRRIQEHKKVSLQVRVAYLEKAETYKSLRRERDKLAYEIFENKPIKALQKQAASYELFLKNEHVFEMIETFKDALYAGNYEERDKAALRVVNKIEGIFIDQSLQIERYAVLGELRMAMEAYTKAQSVKVRNDAHAQIKQMVFGERFYKDRYAVFRQLGGRVRDFKGVPFKDKGPTYTEIRERLDPEAYAHHLLGRHTHHYGQELIWDRPQSKVSLNKQTGQWQDFKTGESGDLIGLASYVKKMSKTEAFLYAKGFVSVKDTSVRDTSVIDTRVRDTNVGRASDTSVRDTSVIDTRAIERVKEVSGWSRPIDGTLAEMYLREERGIKTTELPPDLKFLPEKGLIALARDSEGRATACQITALDMKTGKKDITVDVPKRSHGKVSGSFVKIQEGKHPLYVAEGIETALSLKEAGIKGTIVASLGLHNLGKADHLVKGDLILVADNDGPDKPSTKHVHKIVEGYHARGINCFVTMPIERGQDFNDVLQIKGPRRVQEEVKSQMVKGVIARTKEAERISKDASLAVWKEETITKWNPLDQMREFIKTGTEKSILGKIAALKESKEDKKALQTFMRILKEESPKIFEKTIQQQKGGFER